MLQCAACFNSYSRCGSPIPRSYFLLLRISGRPIDRADIPVNNGLASRHVDTQIHTKARVRSSAAAATRGSSHPIMNLVKLAAIAELQFEAAKCAFSEEVVEAEEVCNRNDSRWSSAFREEPRHARWLRQLSRSRLGSVRARGTYVTSQRV